MGPDVRGVLNIHRGDKFIGRVHLAGERMILGRSPDADVVLDSDTASRQHAEISRNEQGRWMVRDLNSVNGTLVNNREVRSRILMPGDVIKIADYELRFMRSGIQRRQSGRVPAQRTRVTITDAGSGIVKALRDLETPKIDASHLSTLISFSGSLLSTEREAERQSALCNLMVSEKFHGISAVLLRLDRGRTDTTEPEVIAGPFPNSKAWPYISRSALNSVIAKETPVLAASTGNPRQNQVELSMMATEMSAVACPVTRTDKSIDVLYVALPLRYGTAEWLALASLAAEQYDQAQAAWAAREVAQAQARIQDELRRANEIQMSLVPRDFAVSGVDIGFGFEPSKWVGGDYVDAFQTEGGRLFMTVMDVCGKGLQAALIATSLHTSVHLLARGGRLELAHLVWALNEHLLRTLPEDSYVTMWAAVLSPHTGEIETVNCGHPPPLVVSPDGRVRELNSAEHVPLGFIEMDVSSARDVVQPGHMLAAYSDGLSELENEAEEQLGTEGVASMLGEIFRASDSRGASDLSARLRGRLKHYQGEAPVGDDTSFLLAIRGW